MPYDKLTKVLNFQGALYNAKGELVRKLKKSDIYDRSYVDGYSLYEDSRLQIANLQYGQYPYTVEFEFEVKYKYLFQIPSFHLTMQKMSVQQGSFSLVFPTSLAPRYKPMNISQMPVETVEGAKGINSLVWSFKNYEAIKPEPFGLSFDELVPKIMVAPSDFEYEGYVGNMETWDDFGRWVNSLNKGRGVLDSQTRLTAKQLTESLNTTEEKVKKLYEYLQNKTRYVNITLGIGGYQPFEASVVEKTGYGDCKALSNYMVALLESVDIKGYYSLIMAGEDFTPLQTDFPSSQFNHVVVAVPNGPDTLWLECTSQTQPFAYLGSFTDDRHALMILEDGATLVKTPSYGSATNIQARTAEVYVNGKGEATASISTSYSGLQYENGDLNFILNREMS